MNPLETASDDENIEGLDFSEQELIDALNRDRGHVNTIAMLTAWTKLLEAQADPRLGCKGQVLVEIERAKLYTRAKVYDWAEEAWDDAMTLAEGINDPDLIERIRKEYSKFCNED